MKVIIESKKAHEGIIGKVWKEVFDTEFERNIILQAINDIIDEVEAYHATNDTEIDAIESEYIDDIKALKPGDYSFDAGDYNYYIEIKAEGGNEMERIMDELRARFNVDGENERYATYYENKADVLAEVDREIFEEKFNVNIDSVKFPVICLDDANAVDGWIFEAGTDREKILDKAESYFTVKY